MADGDEPERIFQQAIRFHRAQRLLMESSPNDQRGALVYPICVLAAFTIELLLKCLIRIEGGTPPREHDLLCLFNLLSAPTRERLEAMWRDYVQHRVEAFRQDGMMIEPELTEALAAGRKGFEVIRYAPRNRRKNACSTSQLCRTCCSRLHSCFDLIGHKRGQRNVLASSARRLSADHPRKLQHQQP
jgi:HEPN domain-containing protein